MPPDPLTLFLARCSLFAGLTAADLSSLLAGAPLTARGYQRGEVIAFEDDPCDAIGVVLSGSVHIQRIYPSGKVVVLETVREAESFGEALLFADSGAYPATLIAHDDTRLVFISRADALEWMRRSPVFLSNVLRSLSNRILLLNRRIKGLSLGSVRQRVANYILEEAAKQKSTRLTLAWSRDELASALGIPRPSLSRELAAMKTEGWIDFDRRTITVIDPPALAASLGE